jgi:hypothetical protein
VRSNAKRILGIGLICLGVLAAHAIAGAQSKDPFVGTWVFDAAKSSFKPGPALKSATVVIEPAGAGLKVAVDAVGEDGKPTKWGYTTLRDGKDAPVTGSAVYDSAAVTQTSPTTGATVYKKDGKVVSTTKSALSADGKTLTLNSSGTDAKGQAVQNVLVFTKK